MRRELVRALSLPHFPPELMDAILENLHPEDWEANWHDLPTVKRDLRACSLVSRSWNRVARRHLFRDVCCSYQYAPLTDPLSNPSSPSGHFLGPSRDLQWQDFCKARRTTRHKSFAMFHAFLHDSPDPARYIRRLKLENVPDFDFLCDEENEVDQEAFNALLQLLPQLRVLHLCNVRLDINVDISPPLHRATLRRLYISDTSYDEYSKGCAPRIYIAEDLEKLLIHFKFVEELHLSIDSLNDLSPDEMDLLKLGPNPTEIKSLILSGTSSRDVLLFQALDSIVDARGLRQLAVIGPAQGFRAGMPLVPRTFLQRVGANIHRFRYYVHPVSGPDSNVADISACINIQEITVGMTVGGGDDSRIHVTILHIVDFLNLILSPDRLVEIVLEITFSNAANAPLKCVDDFHPLDDAFMDLINRCPALQSVFIEYIAHGPENIREDALPTIITVLFPQLYESNSLTIRPVRESVWQTY